MRTKILAKRKDTSAAKSQKLGTATLQSRLFAIEEESDSSLNALFLTQAQVDRVREAEVEGKEDERRAAATR